MFRFLLFHSFFYYLVISLAIFFLLFFFIYHSVLSFITLFFLCLLCRTLLIYLLFRSFFYYLLSLVTLFLLRFLYLLFCSFFYYLFLSSFTLFLLIIFLFPLLLHLFFYYLVSCLLTLFVIPPSFSSKFSFQSNPVPIHQFSLPFRHLLPFLCAFLIIHSFFLSFILIKGSLVPSIPLFSFFCLAFLSSNRDIFLQSIELLLFHGLYSNDIFY
ncbi:unnamed protein product [Acanthosepion pharaonis]|uniref:Uncharacterized protein n=1 Tax=Acanthosepion pharaonis TaxID=158019 RepID=A0A812EDG0_ACAPH|nr:unnamed protein product [Sepia pharaonis]